MFCENEMNLEFSEQKRSEVMQPPVSIPPRSSPQHYVNFLPFEAPAPARLLSVLLFAAAPADFLVSFSAIILNTQTLVSQLLTAGQEV